MSDVRGLEDLLAALFDGGELRRFVRGLPDGERLERELPGPNASLVSVVSDLVGLLTRRGMVDDDLFRSLKAARPRRGDIDAVRAVVLGAPAPTPTAAPAPPAAAWDFFLAHASADKPRARQLRDHLAPHGAVFLDEDGVQLGDPFSETIAAALARSRVVCVLVSKGLGRALYAQAEVTMAIAMWRQSPADHRIVPLFLDGLPDAADPVLVELRVFHGIDVASEGLDAAARRLVELHRRLAGAP